MYMFNTINRLAKFFLITIVFMNIIFLPVQAYLDTYDSTTSKDILSKTQLNNFLFSKITPLDNDLPFSSSLMDVQSTSESYPESFKIKNLKFDGIILLYILFLITLMTVKIRSKKSQSSVEYIMIIGVVLVFTMPLFYFALSQSRNNIKVNQADDAVNTLSKAVDTVYALGPGSKKYVWISIPKGTSGTYVANKSIGILMSIFGGQSDYFSSTKAEVFGSFPSDAGTYKIPVEALENGLVLIGEGNDTTPPIISLKSPSGLVCPPVVTLRVITNEPAHCKFDTIDTDYGSMGNDFEGEILTHESFLSYEPNGNYTYYVLCQDPFNNTMLSSEAIIFEVNDTLCGTGGDDEGGGSCHFGDTDPPVVTLSSPSNNAEVNVSRVYFTYDVQDVSSIYSCELIINGSTVKTQSTPDKGANQIYYDLDYGNYNWNINCTDFCNVTEGSGAQRNLFVNATFDNEPPVVNLTWPPDGNVTLQNIINFQYVVNDVLSGIYYCNVHVEGILDEGGSVLKSQNDFSVPENTNYIGAQFALDKGNYTWNVTCYDDSPYLNAGISETWTFRVNDTLEYGVALDDLGIDQGWWASLSSVDASDSGLSLQTAEWLDDNVNTPTNYIRKSGGNHQVYIVNASGEANAYIRVSLYVRISTIDEDNYPIRVYAYDPSSPNQVLPLYENFTVDSDILNDKVKWVEYDITATAKLMAGTGWMKFRITTEPTNAKRLQFSEIHIKVG
ncbi:MAG: hypothetical protein V1740_00790 [Candidatus Woesearchaeota archaeon]